MVLLEDLKQELASQKEKVENLRSALKIDQLKEEIAALEEEQAKEGFWNDLEASQKSITLTKQKKDKVEKYESLASHYDDTMTLLEMAMEEDDESLVPELEESAKELTDKIEAMTLETLLNGEYDKNNAIMTFHAGAGGTEAMDWVQMLYRMYTRWAERHDFNYKILDYLEGEEAGIKSATILIEGLNAYGYLKSEMGVHRLVRVSPFDSSGRRHTSFASVEVMPEISDDVDIEINPADLKVDTYRSSGAGGQHVNKTESAIRITHIPTGVVVACQTERSQFQNRDTAMKMLKSKLMEIKEREHLDKIEDIKGEQREIAWGSQIRSYVFMPYTLAKDHRTNYEMGNITAVMDGDIDGFINAYLKQKVEV